MLQLFSFQQYAVEFLVDKRAVLIGDDMGLGKTVQAVVLDEQRRQKHPNLVRKPKTLVVTYLGIVSSWVKHYETWTNHRVIAINNRDRSKLISSLVNDEHDVYIVHWQALRLMPELSKIHWFHVIADECHALQNRKAQQTKALKSIKTEYKTGLSGTPAFDKPDDLWSILNWLYPRFWTSYWKYYDRHVIYVENSGYRVIVGIAHIDELQKQMSGFYIRRKKEDVLLDLPDKYYSVREVELHPKQARAYEQMRKNMLAWVGEHEDEPVAAPVVIAQLTRLQQFSDAFGQMDIETGRMLLSDPSTKLDAVMEIINSTDEPVVVFSQFAMVIELLRARLEQAGISHGIFTGSTSADERTRVLDSFQAGKLRVFAGTIGAGGVGITLTASSTVVFIDRSWSASNNVQAEDRLHRIGQANAVHVIDIISKDTIDAKRIKRINLQWTWIKKLIGDEPMDEDEYEYGEAQW